MRILPALLVLAAPAQAQATPADGCYSNRSQGDLVIVAEGVPSCASKYPKEIAKGMIDELRKVFVSMHVHLKGKTLEAATSDPNEPGQPMIDVARTDTAVVGWLNLKQEVDGGALWQIAGVHDPDQYMHEMLVIGYAVKAADSTLVCGDAIMGMAMRGDLPKKPKDKAKPKPKK